MMHMSNVIRMAGLAAVALSANAHTSYPAKPVGIIVPYFPGSPSDLCARMQGQENTREVHGF